LFKYQHINQNLLGSVVLLLVSVFLLTGFFITDITSLNKGLGIDGMWYNKIISEENYKIDDYHLFKSLPSHLIKTFFDILNIDISHKRILIYFKFFNLICLFSCLLFFNKISKKHLHDRYNLLAILSLLTFIVLKVSNYDVVTPDYFGFLLATIFMYYYLCRKYSFLIVILILSFFTNPIVFLIGMIILIFSNTLPKVIDIKFSSKFSLFFSLLFGFIIFTWSIYMIIPMYKAHVELTLWIIPDTLNIKVFPFSAIVVSAFCAYFSFYLFQYSIPFVNFSNILRLKFKWIILFIIFLAGKSFLISYNNHPINLDDIGHLVYVWPLYFCMKPLTGVSEHIHSLGILIVFALILWKDIVSESSKLFGIGGLIILGLFVLFIIKPEARHALPFVPIISFLVVKVISQNFLEFKNILFVLFLNILFSKIYYPLHIASFSGNPQEFPAQHYFMFFGFSCNYTMYTFQALVSVFIFLFYNKIIFQK